VIQERGRRGQTHCQVAPDGGLEALLLAAEQERLTGDEDIFEAFFCHRRLVS
jgi:hypothetical protein